MALVPRAGQHRVGRLNRVYPFRPPLPTGGTATSLQIVSIAPSLELFREHGKDRTPLLAGAVVSTTTAQTLLSVVASSLGTFGTVMRWRDSAGVYSADFAFTFVVEALPAGTPTLYVDARDTDWNWIRQPALTSGQTVVLIQDLMPCAAVYDHIVAGAKLYAAGTSTADFTAWYKRRDSTNGESTSVQGVGVSTRGYAAADNIMAHDYTGTIVYEVRDSAGNTVETRFIHVEEGGFQYVFEDHAIGSRQSDTVRRLNWQFPDVAEGTGIRIVIEKLVGVQLKAGSSGGSLSLSTRNVGDNIYADLDDLHFSLAPGRPVGLDGYVEARLIEQGYPDRFARHYHYTWPDEPLDWADDARCWFGGAGGYAVRRVARWGYKGGDWRDATGTLYGSESFLPRDDSTRVVSSGHPTTYDLDVTDYVRAYGAGFRINAVGPRPPTIALWGDGDSANRPALLVTKDGVTTSLSTRVNGRTYHASTQASGSPMASDDDSVTLFSDLLVQFNQAADPTIENATLRLTVTGLGSGGSGDNYLRLFRPQWRPPYGAPLAAIGEPIDNSTPFDGRADYLYRARTTAEWESTSAKLGDGRHRNFQDAMYSRTCRPGQDSNKVYGRLSTPAKLRYNEMGIARRQPKMGAGYLLWVGKEIRPPLRGPTLHPDQSEGKLNGFYCGQGGAGAGPIFGRTTFTDRLGWRSAWEEAMTTDHPLYQLPIWLMSYSYHVEKHNDNGVSPSTFMGWLPLESWNHLDARVSVNTVDDRGASDQNGVTEIAVNGNLIFRFARQKQRTHRFRVGSTLSTLEWEGMFWNFYLGGYEEAEPTFDFGRPFGVGVSHLAVTDGSKWAGDPRLKPGFTGLPAAPDQFGRPQPQVPTLELEWNALRARAGSLRASVGTTSNSASIVGVAATAAARPVTAGSGTNISTNVPGVAATPAARPMTVESGQSRTVNLTGVGAGAGAGFVSTTQRTSREVVIASVGGRPVIGQVVAVGGEVASGGTPRAMRFRVIPRTPLRA